MSKKNLYLSTVDEQYLKERYRVGQSPDTDTDPQAVPYGPRPTAKTEVYDLTPGRALLFLTGSAILVFDSGSVAAEMRRPIGWKLSHTT